MRGELVESSRRVSTRPTVLVVDDEPLVRWLVCEMLSDSGYGVTQVSDALQALTAVKACGPNIDDLRRRIIRCGLNDAMAASSTEAKAV